MVTQTHIMMYVYIVLPISITGLLPVADQYNNIFLVSCIHFSSVCVFFFFLVYLTMCLYMIGNRNNLHPASGYDDVKL